LSDFKELYQQHHKKVFNVALNIVRHVEDAEDIVQEVFVEVHRSQHLFKEESAVFTWIYRITVNKSLDFLRAKRSKKRFAFLTNLFNRETGEQLHEASHFDHPGVELEKKERTQILFKAIDTLPENQRTAFVLTQIEQFTQKEAGAIMNVGEKAVESLIQRAKANLRKELGNLYNNRRI